MKQLQTIFLASAASILLITSHINGQTVTADISYGELVDKITILTIKSERISDIHKLKNILTELRLLLATYNEYVGDRTDIAELQTQLYENNKAQWDMEDEFRIKEDANDFGDEFIGVARSIRTSNDRRCILKKKIDALLGSLITEEKSYAKLG